MADELTYSISILHLYSDTLKLIHLDPQTPEATRVMLDELFANGSSLFPLLIVGGSERLARQTALLRQCTEICNGLLGEISRDPATPYATQVLITRAMIRLGHMAQRRQRERLSYEHVRDEVCTEPGNIPPPRRPRLEVYECGNAQPREVMVFRR